MFFYNFCINKLGFGILGVRVMRFQYVTLGVAIILSHCLFENWCQGLSSGTIPHS